MKTLIISMLCMLPLFASAQQPATLTVSGKSTTEVTPDITVINITLSANNMDYGKSIDLLKEKSDNIKAFLKKKGINKEDIKAENFNIRKNYVYENRKQVFKGYNATSHIRLEFLNDNAQANKIINAIGESNAEAEVNVNFKLSQDLKDSVNDQLIEAAIVDAKKRADIIAKATNQKILQISKINYGVKENVAVTFDSEARVFAMADKSGATERESLSITPQPIEKSTEIIIYWLLVSD